MKANISIYKTILTVLICFFSTISLANDPTAIPWPVGTTEGLMNFTKTLMNSYGDPQNDWDKGKSHCGLDFDSHTESPVCSDVRCVIDNAVISHWFWTPFEPDTLPREWVVVTTLGTDSINHEDFGWVYEHFTC